MDRDDEIHVDILRSRRTTLAAEVHPDGRVVVRAPRELGQEYIRDFLDRRRDWILRQRARAMARAAALRDVPPLTEGELRQLMAAARTDMAARAARYAPIVGTTYGRITIRAQRTKWGSCSAAGNLNFNCLLMLAPPEVRDYVVVHELCHRRHMDHGPRFWAEVERVLPDWQERRRWLRTDGDMLMARLYGMQAALRKNA